MRSLRAMISASDIDYLTQLNGLLRSTPIPPNLNSTVFFFNQTFTDGPIGEGNFKLMPISFNTTADTINGEVTGFNGNDSAVIKSAIERLNTNDNRKIGSLFARIAPAWVNPVIYDPSAVPLYSKTACTVFANAYHRYWNAGTQYEGPVTTDDNSLLHYTSFDAQLDGIALACNTVSISGYFANIRPSMMKCISSLMVNGATNWYTNRFSYIWSTSLNRNAWFPSNLRIESTFSRMERSRAYLGTIYFGRLNGSISVSGVTRAVCNESAKDLLSWMMSIETIPNSKKSSGEHKYRRSTTKDKVNTKTDAVTGAEQNK